ncbi:hypothetical protein GC174_02995 [bacterium]|nr:hypothetical protein [bacterium]
MDQLFLSLQKRFLVPIVIVGSLFAWLILCHANYKSYWYGTIYRVQTTDFNILHHSLPPTLSRMILEGKSDLVQKTLDSTYGLFGLVITDPEGQTVLWQTNKVYHRESWHKKINPEYLKNLKEPFDVLTAPATLEPLYEHESPRSDKATRVGSVDSMDGQIIGRLYYVRSIPPPFLEDLGNFLTKGFWVLSGAKRGYLFITLSTMAFAMVVLLVVWLRRRGLELKQKEVEHFKRELEIRKKALEHLTQELEAQKSRKQALEKEADQAYRRAVGLKVALEKLRDALPGGAVQQGNQNGSTELRVRPPAHPQSSILEEIEELLPSLSENAQVLKDQAGMLHEYCATLENRQMEMQRIVDNAFRQAAGFGGAAATGSSSGAGSATGLDKGSGYIDMSPK